LKLINYDEVAKRSAIYSKHEYLSLIIEVFKV